MKRIFYTLITLSAFSSIYARELNVADPTIFVDNGKYYLYGTSADSNQGFDVYVSTNLSDWYGPAGNKDGKVLTKGDAFGSKWFWAPQVVKSDSTYYMLYTADEQIAVAHSDSPLGPFVNDGTPLPAATRRIDPFLFQDTDGSYILYHVRLDGQNKICLSTPDVESIDVLCSAPGTWEDTANAQWRVAEGPTVIKRGDKYHLFYSANDFRNPDYAVGHAIADSPEGPWKKEDQPIISRHNTGYNGTGHGDIFVDNEGNLRYVFHVHQSADKVAPRRTLIATIIENSDGTFKLDTNSIIVPNLSGN